MKKFTVMSLFFKLTLIGTVVYLSHIVHLSQDKKRFEQPVLVACQK